MQVTLKQTGEVDRIILGHEGQNLLNLLANQGIYVDAPCAGRGKCGKCRVKVTGGVTPPDEKEMEFLGDNTSGDRLACQARLTGDATVELAAKVRFSSVKGLGESEPYDINSPLKIVPFSKLDSKNTTDLMTARKIKSASFEALNQLATLDLEREPGLGVMWDDELLEVRRTEKPLLAAAIDVGTTGLAVAIIDIIKGEVIAQGTGLNPQTTCGGDVISRITNAVEEPGNLANLQKLVVDGLGQLIVETMGSEEKASQIMAVAISANTTMVYLLAGLNPGGLAQSPYRPVCIKSLDLSHLASGLKIGTNAKVFTAPNISAYVGGDITAGMLAVALKKREGTVLYIDIGTNGEIVLSHKGRLVATSCAAGPALEGMNIICGQRATPGAVDSFTMTPDFKFRYTTIGETHPTGICGSGLVDIAATLVDRGLIDKTGRLVKPQTVPDGASWLEELEDGRFTFAEKVFFDQKDIRQVQLAKGAIAAAVEMLLARLELKETDLDEVVIAGAFGFHLKQESLKSIGLIPASYQGPVSFVGNASLAGSARILLTPGAINELNSLADETEVLELGFDPQFQTIFVKHLRF